MYIYKISGEYPLNQTVLDINWNFIISSSRNSQQ